MLFLNHLKTTKLLIENVLFFYFPIPFILSFIPLKSHKDLVYTMSLFQPGDLKELITT